MLVCAPGGEWIIRSRPVARQVVPELQTCKEVNVAGLTDRERRPDQLAAYEARCERLASFVLSQVSTRCQVPGPLLDVGISEGSVTARLSKLVNRDLIAIDVKPHLRSSLKGAFSYILGNATNLPFADESFAAVSFLDVYEHIPPPSRARSIREVYRVLRPRGLLVGKLPNMNFPIEPHSYLPLVQFLPRGAEAWLYANLPSPTGEPEAERRRGVHWFRATRRDLSKDLAEAGFVEGEFSRSQYELSSLPAIGRRFAPVLRIFPAGYDFWYRKGPNPH